MKEAIITEFVNFKVSETTTVEQVMLKADLLNEFQKQQDGFIDAELVKDMQENAWCLIYHFGNIEKVKAIGEKIRSSREFGEFVALVAPGSIRITLNQHFKRW